MSVVKKYSSQIINPSKCLSLMISDARLQNNVLSISGLEEYPKKNFDSKALAGGKVFSRIIDHNFRTEGGS